MNYYTSIHPIDQPIPAQRQQAKRHYGVHPYFTRRPFNVIREYILKFSQDRDCVLDPFGGSGVTAIEAFLENRRAIHNDINPLANFIATGIAGLAKGNLADYRATLEELKIACQPELEKIQKGDQKFVESELSSFDLPGNIQLPSTSDVQHYHDLFTPRQFAALALLKARIDEVPDAISRNAMLLAWSASLGKLNRTFLSAKGRAASRGGTSIFSIYRYKIAKDPVELPPWQTFEERALNVLVAKKELDHVIKLKQTTTGWHGSFECQALDVEELSVRLEGEVDYIFTDPPYGGHISYLDLSILWNNWLGLEPKQEVREKEIIVGGELRHTEEEYVARLKQSIFACLRMLKKGRWLSVVFQHWNIAYFEAILSAAAEAGAELRAAIPQIGDPIWSMHKKKNKESVLAGEMILTFHKTGATRYAQNGAHFDLGETVQKILSKTTGHYFYGESLFNQVVVQAWKTGAINALATSKDEFTELIKNLGWQYDPQHHYWSKQEKLQPTLFD
jgi:adenine-specific DNA methylase